MPAHLPQTAAAAPRAASLAPPHPAVPACAGRPGGSRPRKTVRKGGREGQAIVGLGVVRHGQANFTKESLREWLHQASGGNPWGKTGGAGRQAAGGRQQAAACQPTCTPGWDMAWDQVLRPERRTTTCLQRSSRGVPAGRRVCGWHVAGLWPMLEGRQAGWRSAAGVASCIARAGPYATLPARVLLDALPQLARQPGGPSRRVAADAGHPEAGRFHQVLQAGRVSAEQGSGVGTGGDARQTSCFHNCLSAGSCEDDAWVAAKAHG